MSHCNELIATRDDWQKLCASAATTCAAWALIGRSRGWHGVRYLVAEVLPMDTSQAEACERSCAEGLGLLELTADNAASRLDALSRAVACRPLLAASATSPHGGWCVDGANTRIRPLSAIRLFDQNGQTHVQDVAVSNTFTESLHPRLQRQILAFGAEGQSKLHDLAVAVVGCGGTGGLLAQLLALSGVGQLVLIDHDRIEQTNRNRLVAASDADVQQGRYKVSALQHHLQRLAPDVTIDALPFSLYDERSTRAILSSDMLVGCTDNEGSRLHMNHLAVQHFVPYVDCGVGIQHGSSGLTAGGQVRVVLPGGPCLECYGGINRWLAAEDLAAPAIHALRRAHGYGLGDAAPVPAVAFLNAIIAAEAAASVVALTTGLRPLAPYVAYDLLQSRMAPRDDIRRSPGCPTCAPGQRFGRGDTLPLAQPNSNVQLPVAPVVTEV